jgi:hypothetical protein
MPEHLPKLFTLGENLITPGALAVLNGRGAEWLKLLSRHVTGQWDEMTPEDQEANVRAVAEGSRIFSRFTLKDGVVIWVITEAQDDDGQRAATTILLPEDY